MEAPLTDQPEKLTQAWGEGVASGLWKTYRKFPVPWRGATVLDFGCHWGYLLKHLLESGEIAQGVGIDSKPHWQNMADGFKPAGIKGLRLYSGDALSIGEAQTIELDVVLSSGTLMLLRPEYLEQLLAWFYDRLKPGGHAILRTRTFLSYAGGDLHSRLKTPVPHLLFSTRTLNQYFQNKKQPPIRYMSPLCGATYLMYYRAAGFEILDVERIPNRIDKAALSRHHRKLGMFDDRELDTTEITAFLRKPATAPDLSKIAVD